MNKTDHPKIFFSTQMVESGRIILDIDQFFLKYSLPGNTKSALEHLLNLEWHRLDNYLKRVRPLEAAHRKNSEKQNSTNDTTVNHIRRYQALERVEQSCAHIAQGFAKREYDRCVVFGLSRSVMMGMKIFLSQFYPAVIHAGSNPENAERHVRLFNSGKKKVLILNIKAGFGFDLRCANHAFFVEHALNVESNVKALEQLYAKGRKDPVHVKSFSLNDPLDIKLSELLRCGMQRLVRGESAELPKEYL